ncbi:hypothetical protein BT67DRAFT_439983 [Trichocladium antarcticum]|uniref:Uncharacterized protein n=1 Tax=Trichocladium antarcticum TaxID=1450529 RepID=A0AAN6UQA6_9PEZI|nr:hypothetical protein BT67DRAFT_439983 [Trichocladium antarcticum]
MLCGLHQPSPHSHQQPRFLRSFRGRRNLKAKQGEQDEAMFSRDRRPSDASSLARSISETSNSRCPSTSSRRTDLSVDWDPLRLHPPHAAAPDLPLRDSTTSSRRYEPHARPSHSPRTPPPQQHPPSSPPSSPPSPSNSTVIYDGFDFGFPSDGGRNKPTPTTAATASRGRRRDPSPAPSIASSTSSGSSFSCWSDAADDDSPHGLGLAPERGGRLLYPTRRVEEARGGVCEHGVRAGGGGGEFHDLTT